ncbi:MAG TPA: tetratricopeptide repeat protein [Actinomycetes bacterium]|nr:tetratricopeptide repeat protein [Actinomycetes bacterium]
MTEIVGRDAELAAVRELMARQGDGRSALLLEGDAGIGKSTLWQAGIAAAERHGHRVLSARPAEAEAQLALAGLGDLLDSCADEVLPRLTPPQRRALEVALVLADPDNDVPDPRALGVAVRSALRLLAEGATLVLAIDDVQWLDRTSGGAVGFALRRLDDASVRLLLTRRGAPTAVEAALAGGRTEVLRVEPLSVGAVHGLLRNSLGRTFPRPTLRRLHEASGGNPLYALELARALGDGTARGPLDPLPLTPSLERLVDARLRALPEPTRAGLLVAAVVGAPTTELLEAAGVPTDVLAPAVEAEVVEVRAGIVRFAHPLLASETVARASPGQRTEAHRRAAEVLDEPLARAVHVAASLDGPDPDAADELDRAVRTARARGATALAAELGEAAMRATPAEQREERGRRARAAARDHLASGESERGFALARALLTDEPAGRQRADVLALLGDLEGENGALETAAEHRRAALVAAEGDAARQSRLHEQLAYVVRITESLDVAVAHAREALRLAEEVADDLLTARALGTLAVLLCNGGDPVALDLSERGLALARRSDEQDTVLFAAQAVGHCLYWSGRTERALEVLTELLRLAEDRDEPVTVNALWYLALVEERSGRYDVARRHAQRSMELSAQYRLPGADYDPVVAFPLARVALAQGEHDLVRELVAPVVAGEGPPGGRSTDRSLLAVLATLDRREGRTGEALARFETVEEGQRSAGFSRAMAFWVDEYVEALLEAGRPDEASVVVDDWDLQVQRLGHRLAPAQVLRCRGMLAAAAGDLESAAATFAAAVDLHRPLLDPYERGRALLSLGQASRRLKQKRAAREALEAAAAQFAAIGAAWWVDRVRSEVGSVGGRTRVEGLTPAEQRVAALVAEGRTNREVASTLFLGESTVEKHLTHIYAKLGVRSRTELARALS